MKYAADPAHSAAVADGSKDNSIHDEVWGRSASAPWGDAYCTRACYLQQFKTELHLISKLPNGVRRRMLIRQWSTFNVLANMHQSLVRRPPLLIIPSPKLTHPVRPECAGMAGE